MKTSLLATAILLGQSTAMAALSTASDLDSAVRLRSAEEAEASTVTQTQTFAPETLHWDGPNFYGIGSGGGTLLAAARFTASRPRTLTNMLWYAYDSFDWASIIVYGHGSDTSPGPVLDSFPYTGSGTGWKDVLLPRPLYLPAYRDFWACVAVNHPPRVRPCRHRLRTPGPGQRRIHPDSGWFVASALPVQTRLQLEHQGCGGARRT